MIGAGSPNDGFSHEKGAPQSREDWEALSSAEKSYWEQRRRRRNFIRRHGHRAKGIAQIVNPQGRPPSAGSMRGRGQLRKKRLLSDHPVQIPTPEQLADKPGLEPTRPIPDSGHRGPSGNTYGTDLRMIRRATRERWKIKEDSTNSVPESLERIINATEDSNPAIALQAINQLAKLMAQNQADEHEEVKRSSLTKEQAAQLASAIIETIRSEVDDPAVRQKIISSLGARMMALGIVSAPQRTLPDTPAHPNTGFES